MAGSNEFRHKDVGASLSKAEWEAIGTHIFNSQATGDILYASSATQLSRLAKGTQGYPLVMGASVPQWGGAVTITGAAILAGGLNTYGATLLHSGLGVAGLTNLQQTLIHSTLGVAGLASFVEVFITNDITVGGTVDGVDISAHNIATTGVHGVTGTIIGSEDTIAALTAPTADFSMNTHKITSVVDPTSAQHAATKKYHDDNRLASKVKEETRDMTAATGDVSYTGYGFLPTSLIVFSVIDTGTHAASWGMADSALAEVCVYKTYEAKDAGYAYLLVMTELNESTRYQRALLKTFDADGFTLAWTKGGTTSGGTCKLQILALR